jgi:uncharacterized membrane protein YeiH
MNFSFDFSVSQAHALPDWLELLAMMTTALYGAAVARSRDVPIYGTLLSGIMVGIGGGLCRDIMLNLKPVAIYTWYFLPAMMLSSVVGALFFYKLVKQQVPNLVFHGLAVGLLISIGAQKALVYQAPIVSALLCGVVTASFGGMIADWIAQERTVVGKQAHWFGAALSVGTICYLIGSILINFYVGIAMSVVVTTSLRVLSVTRNWPSPFWPNENTKS